MRKPEGFEFAGEVWVDSGQLTIVDPCYVDEGFDYSKWLDERTEKPDGSAEGPVSGSFTMHTAWGDGTYPVYVKKDNRGQITAMLVDTDPDEEIDWDSYPGEESDLY